MNLKVKTRSEDRQPYIPALIITFVFGIVGIIGIGWLATLILRFDLGFFIEEFSENGMAILVFLSLGAVGFLLMYYFFKSPREYIGKLKKKENVSYKGKDIWKMDFRIEGKDKNSMTLSCYTEEENDLKTGEKYAVLLKEFNWKIFSINDIKEDKEYELVQAPTIKPIFYMFFFILGSGLVFLLFKTIYDFEKRNDYLINLIPLVILGFVFFTLFKIYIECYHDENSSTDLEKDGEKK